MWCSTNKPMPDSHTVESISASKENPTCEGDGLMLLIIENWLDTSNFLSATHFMPCIYALDINFWRKKSIPTPRKNEITDQSFNGLKSLTFVFSDFTLSLDAKKVFGQCWKSAAFDLRNGCWMVSAWDSGLGAMRFEIRGTNYVVLN